MACAAALAVAVTGATAGPPVAPAGAATSATVALGTEVASLGTSGTAVPTEGAQAPSVSDDGRFVAFTTAGPAAPGDDNGGSLDVYVRDRLVGTTTLVSRAPDGTAGSGSSSRPEISGNGRFVAFDSNAPDLVDGDDNGVFDVFVHDRSTGTTERVSETADGGAGDLASTNPTISDDGRMVVFESDATTLVPGDTNGRRDIYLKDRQTGGVQRISRTSTGGQPDGNSYEPAISGSGLHVAFGSAATNLTPAAAAAPHVYLRDRLSGTIERVSLTDADTTPDAAAYAPALSDNGRYVAFYSLATDLVAGDTNAERDVFVRDRTAGTTVRASVATGGSQASGASGAMSISDDGRTVAFVSVAADLAPGDTNGRTDVYVRDLANDITVRGSRTTAGGLPNVAPSVPGPNLSGAPALSGDARTLGFVSTATNMVAGGTAVPGVYVTRFGTALPPAFVDVAPTSPFLEAIQWMVVSGITTGYADGGFHPGDPVSRQAIAAFLHRATGQPAPTGACDTTGGFTDVPAAHPFCHQIMWMVDAGLAQGYGDGTFRPTVAITRQALAAFLFRLSGEDLPPTCDPAPFADVTPAHPFCRQIGWVAALGVTGGYPDGTFRPGAVITRQAAAAFLYRHDRLT